MKYLHRYILIIILLIGFGLRFYQLGEIPVGFHRDEAFLGYNAYSILKTGRDMTGHLLPLHLESFIQSPGGYSYAAIPFIFLFGLSPFSVRFASALFGSLTILLVYFLVKELFSFSKNTGPYTTSDPQSTILSLLSAALLAISPWHITLSRVSTENTIVVFFITLGVYLFLLFVRIKQWKFVFLSFISFFITLGLYQAPRAFLPLFIPVILLLLWTKLNNKRRFTSILLYLLCICFPLLLILMSPQLSLRLRTVNIFYSEETKLVLDEQIREDGTKNVPIIATRFFHNKPIAYMKEMIGNYFKHFSYPFLFSDAGLPQRYTIYKTGLLYLFELPFILMGLYYLVKRHTSNDILVLSWLFLAPVGSALTFDDIPNLQRTLIVFPALTIVIAHGVLYFYQKLKQYAHILVIPIFSIVLLVASYEILSYLHQYYIQQQTHRPWYRHEGYKELVASVNSIIGTNGKAVITASESAPTIFFLFFGIYDPLLFQQETKNASVLSIDRTNFSRYTFTLEECPYKEFIEDDVKTGKIIVTHTAKPNTLYVNYGICKEITKSGDTLKTIRRGDGTPVFSIVRLK